MPHHPLRSTLAALLLGATLLIPWLAGSTASAAQPTSRPAPVIASTPAGPFALFWQTLVQLVYGGPLVGRQTAPRSHPLPDAGCGPTPDGQCATSSPGNAG